MGGSEIFYVFLGILGRYQVWRKYADFSRRWLMESHDLSILVFATSSWMIIAPMRLHPSNCQVRKSSKEYKVLSHLLLQDRLHSDEVSSV
jgi:hypothetical protein